MEPHQLGMKTDFVPVFFDLETTGHGDGAELIQIGAIHKRIAFCSYILPRRRIPAQITDVTGFEKMDNLLLYRGQIKETTPLREALQDFLDYLRHFNKPIILVAHNCFIFDSRFILQNYKKFYMLDELSTVVQGFADSLPLLKKYLPGRSSYKQKELAQAILGPDYEFIAHEAVNDCTALVDIFRKEKLTMNMIFEFSRSFDYTLDNYNARIVAKQKLVTLERLRPFVTGSMLAKIADAGLDFNALKWRIVQNGEEGLSLYLSEILRDGKPRVTRNRRALQSICDGVMHSLDGGHYGGH